MCISRDLRILRSCRSCDSRGPEILRSCRRRRSASIVPVLAFYSKRGPDLTSENLANLKILHVRRSQNRKNLQILQIRGPRILRLMDPQIDDGRRFPSTNTVGSSLVHVQFTVDPKAGSTHGERAIRHPLPAIPRHMVQAKRPCEGAHKSGQEHVYAVA